MDWKHATTYKGKDTEGRHCTGVRIVYLSELISEHVQDFFNSVLFLHMPLMICRWGLDCFLNDFWKGIIPQCLTSSSWKTALCLSNTKTELSQNTLPCAISSYVFWLTIRSTILAGLPTLEISSLWNRLSIRGLLIKPLKPVLVYIYIYIYHSTIHIQYTTQSWIH